MSSRRKGGTGPTGSPMKVDRVRGTIGFTTRDEADGARVTNAPSYYERHERWKRNLSEEDFKALLWSVLMQHHHDKRSYDIPPELVRKISCPPKLTTTDLRWLQKQKGYNFIAKQVHSSFLLSKMKAKS